MKSRSPGYRPGDHHAICDRCGFAYRASELKKTWDNLWVCAKDWEPRQPQDFVRARPDRIKPAGPIRPDDNEGENQTIDTSEIPSGTFDNSL